MLEEAINTFEELKKYTFIIDRGNKKPIIIKFNNDNFYHLIGLHKTNIDIFFPSFIKSKDKKYKYIKKHIKKFEKILINQIQDQDILISRISTFSNILDMLKENKNTALYNLKQKVPGSIYDGDFGLLKFYEEKICCLFGLKSEQENSCYIYCAPQSWMASNRINRLVEGKMQIYMKSIISIPSNILNKNFEEIVI